MEDGMASAEGMDQSCRLSGPRQGSASGLSLKVSYFQVPIAHFQESPIRNAGIFQHLCAPVSCALSSKNLCWQVGFSLLYPIPRACPTLCFCSGGASRGNTLVART